MQQRPRWLWVVLAVSVTASVGGLLARNRAAPAAPHLRALFRAVPSALPAAAGDEDPTRLLRTPSDEPARLLCGQARLVADQIQQNLVVPPHHVDPKAFVMSVADWLDPHGLWSASPDAPFPEAARGVAPQLLSSFEHPEQAAGCGAAAELGSVLATWVDELRAIYDRSFAEASRQPVDAEAIWATSSDAAFEDGPVTVPARELAAKLGQRAAVIAEGLGPHGARIASSLRHRLFPPLSASAWSEVVLSAALRAFVLHVDPHGAWAPLDEETSLYEVELEASGRSRMWAQTHRTAAGLRLDGSVTSPLKPGDVVLSVGPVLTAGLTVEQADQLGVLDPADPDPTRQVRVLRAGSLAPVSLQLSPQPYSPSEAPAASVQLDHIPYRDGRVLVLGIPDVPDDLGEQVEETLDRERQSGTPEGLLLDLRGNGGGSIDGAKAALGLFLPGAPLFPMLRRDGSVELESAPTPAANEQYDGPIAVLVDGNTASAAEMIAGALSVYQRATLVGSRTFGKGCAQEYVDDQAGVGVLRLTTLLYALPDGSPVQRIGLSPSLRIEAPGDGEREAGLENSFPTWRGPDVRRRALIKPVAWPPSSGRVGPCEDPAVCQALRLVGAPRPATARTRRP